jgi:hypothetical protein
MSIKYRELLKEYGVTLESDVLDPAFVVKAKDFEQKMEKGELTDEQTVELDNELVELFYKHDLEEEDSDEVKKLKRDAEITNITAKIEKAADLQSLAAIEKEFLAEYPEIKEKYDKKKAQLEKIVADANKKKEQEATELLVKKAKEEIAACDYSNLQALGEKYKQYPELVEIIKKRHADEAPGKENERIAQTLRSKKEWSYVELRQMGIEPTGSDMTVAGVILQKEFLFNVYSVRK